MSIYWNISGGRVATLAPGEGAFDLYSEVLEREGC